MNIKLCRVAVDMGMRPGPSSFPRPDCKAGPKGSFACPNATNPGRTHRFFIGKPTVPFGFGLSYTNFSYKVTQAPSAAVALDTLAAALAPHAPSPPQRVVDALGPIVQHAITVTNEGTKDADDVVLGFMKPPGAGQNGVPLQTLYVNMPAI